VIENLAAKSVQNAQMVDSSDEETLPGDVLADHFTNIRDALRTLAEAMHMTADVFGHTAPRASWLAQAISAQCTAHALVAETVADAHRATSPATPRRKNRKNRSLRTSL
jgi:hypothetical protein